MKSRIMRFNLQTLSFQRNIFAATTLLLASSVAILSCFLFIKEERIVITPAVIEKSFWVENGAVSATYLEQFGVFLGQLLLNKSAQSAAEQRTIILRHTETSFYTKLRQRLIEEEQLLKNQSAAYVFYPTQVKVDNHKLTVKLTGDRQSFTGDKTLSSKTESYLLSFTYQNSRLFLTSLEALEKEST